MGRFVVEYNNTSHGDPYGDRRERDIHINHLAVSDAAAVCSHICGWAWGHGESLITSSRDWSMHNVDTRDGFALCELRSTRNPMIRTMFIRITGDLLVSGPW